jgi:hypothetical protein
MSVDNRAEYRLRTIFIASVMNYYSSILYIYRNMFETKQTNGWQISVTSTGNCQREKKAPKKMATGLQCH